MPTERKGILAEYLEHTTSKILGIGKLNPELGFFEAGMDSLMTEELQDKLQADMGSLHRFPSTIAFDYPNVEKLMDYFEEHLFPLIGIKAEAKKDAIPLLQN